MTNTKFVVGGWYFFTTMQDHADFASRYNDNRDMAHFVGSGRFKIIGEEGCVYKIARPAYDGTDDMEVMYCEVTSYEMKYFSTAYDKFWCKGAAYQLDDIKGLYNKSVINKAFIDTVGFNPFRVVSTIDGINCVKTSKIEFLSKDGVTYETMNITFTEEEIEFFNEWKQLMTGGFNVGLDALTLGTPTRYNTRPIVEIDSADECNVQVQMRGVPSLAIPEIRLTITTMEEVHAAIVMLQGLKNAVV